MDTAETLTGKIKTLSECAWDNRIKQNDIDQWLANFRGKSESATKVQQIHALHLLSQFVYFGSNQMRELIKALYRDLFRYPVLKSIRLSNGNTLNETQLTKLFLANLHKTRFLGMGNPSESGCHLLYYFRQENALPKSLFIHSHEVFSRSKTTRKQRLRHPSVKHYVFIDDFCGSGDQGVEYSEDIVEEMKRLDPNVRVSYYVLFATQAGLKKIGRESAFDNVGCVIDLDGSFRAFGKRSRYFTRCPKRVTLRSSRAFCLKYGERLFSDPLGYRNSQLMIGFHHNTPDNTLPIFWYGEDESIWRPIFKRYQKYYGEV